ncbi:YeiH family protein [Zavarzinia compransoris]|uniref:YeiH family protein n=1 Tax=Zavarzinia marina TaxID=2911065 RepID=UPI001F1CBF2B|nr:YeiH family protein [Zavarzinia marina]MCF4165270.1 YeiH family protein [Zavarzinia marina]
MSSTPILSLSDPVPLARRAGDVLPGLLLAGGIGLAATALNRLPAFGALSPMILAIALGIGLGNLARLPARVRPGIAFSMRRLLRAGIVLLGLQLTMAQVFAVGPGGLAVIALSLAATFGFTTLAGRLLGVGRELTALIAAGTSICGASAVLAANTAVRGRDEDVAYAVACVTIFGSIAMFAYPALAGLADLGPRAFGLWAGASIHEIAQVVAAAYQRGTEAGDFGTVAKLSRVMLLAPVVLLLGLGRGGQGAARPPVPWFVLGFIVLVGLNSVVDVPAGLRAAAAPLTGFLLATALAAMGLETDLRRLKAEGLRPLLLALLAFVFIAGFSLLLVEVIG